MIQQFMQKKCIHLILLLLIKHFASGNHSYLFVIGNEVIKFKAKNQSVSGKLSLGNISADFNQADRKSAGLYGYVYDFSFDYNAIAVDGILDINKYLMEKNDIV